MLDDEDAQLTPKQAEAYSNAMDEGAEDDWVLAEEVGNPKTIDALVMKHILQDATNDAGKRYVAIEGVRLDEPPNHGTPAEELENELSSLAQMSAADDAD